MIVTDWFVHIHLHKSGGTFVNECLMRFFSDARWLGYHLPRSLIPPELSARPVLGFVRNPWSYYVSWYAFQSQRPHPNLLFRCVSENGTLNFNATVRNLLQLGEFPEKLDDLIAALPKEFTNQGLNLPAFALAPLRGRGMGFYSYLYEYMYNGDPTGIHIGRMERLRQDLLAFLQDLQIPVSQPMRDFIERESPRNTSYHGPYQTYYDSATRNMVARCDQSLIDTFGYSFIRPD